MIVTLLLFALLAIAAGAALTVSEPSRLKGDNLPVMGNR
jgi:hypothetical protein